MDYLPAICYVGDDAASRSGRPSRWSADGPRHRQATDCSATGPYTETMGNVLARIENAMVAAKHARSG